MLNKFLIVLMVTMLADTTPRFEVVVEAFAWVESRHNPNAVNGNCVGYLQISPIMVREANRMAGEERFTLDDRWDKEKSIDMFRVIMEKKNPTLDIDKACIIWNGRGCSQQYKDAIKARIKEL